MERSELLALKPPIELFQGLNCVEKETSLPTLPKSRALTARHIPISVPRKELRGGASVHSLEEETSAQMQGTFDALPGSGVLHLVHFVF